jgi:hypothetical protein
VADYRVYRVSPHQAGNMYPIEALKSFCRLHLFEYLP